MPVRGNGFCFLNALDLVLYCDYNEVVIVASLASSILGHLVANVDHYKWFHAEDILRDTEGYFKFGNSCHSVINLIIIANTKALNINGNIQVIEQTTDTKFREIHLKFMWDPIMQLKNHYDAILLPHKCHQVFDHEEDNFESPRLTSSQPIMQTCKIMHMR